LVRGTELAVTSITRKLKAPRNKEKHWLKFASLVFVGYENPKIGFGTTNHELVYSEMNQKMTTLKPPAKALNKLTKETGHNT
jgi:hypothetical protein